MSVNTVPEGIMTVSEHGKVTIRQNDGSTHIITYPRKISLHGDKVERLRNDGVVSYNYADSYYQSTASNTIISYVYTRRTCDFAHCYARINGKGEYIYYRNLKFVVIEYPDGWIYYREIQGTISVIENRGINYYSLMNNSEQKGFVTHIYNYRIGELIDVQDLYHDFSNPLNVSDNVVYTDPQPMEKVD